MVRVVPGAYSAAFPGGMKRENPFCMELKYFGIKMILGKVRCTSKVRRMEGMER